MLPNSRLRAVRRIITHAGCADGRASALLLHAALLGAEVVEMAYGEPAHEHLVASEGLLFCDFTPPKRRLSEFAEAGAIVLDHHERVLVEPFGSLGVFGENLRAESGAWLAYREVYLPLRGRWWSRLWRGAELEAAHRLARLASIRDTWQKGHARWGEASALSEVLRLVPLDRAINMGLQRFMVLADELGPVLLAKRLEEVTEAARRAIRWTVHGAVVGGRMRFGIVPQCGLAEDVIDLLGPDVDVLAGFDYRHGIDRGRPHAYLKVSLRSRNGVDVRAIAKRHGGGGHAAAASFKLPVDLDPMALDASPHALIRDILEAGPWS